MQQEISLKQAEDLIATVGNIAFSGSLYMLSLVGKPSARLKYADISRDADSPIVPVSATIVVSSPSVALFLTMCDAFSNERGDTNASCCLRGLYIYIFSFCESASRDMSAFFSLADGLPTKESIYQKPMEAIIPSDPAARVILVMRELMSITEQHFEAWLTYLQRLPMEIQALFAVNIMASSRKQVASQNKAFIDWAVKNNQYF